MKYFNYNELTKSATAARLGIDNTPSAAVKANLKAVVENILTLCARSGVRLSS